MSRPTPPSTTSTNTGPDSSTPTPTPNHRPNRPNHRVAITIGVIGVVLLAALVVALSRGDKHSNPTAGPPSAAVGHIHGIGIDPADGRLYIGAHQGVFLVDTDGIDVVDVVDGVEGAYGVDGVDGTVGGVRPVGEDRFDTMGFTIAGPNQFLASGHPGIASDRPPHLGLIESKDAAATWTTLSLEGEADFHALESAGRRTWGADSIGGRLLTSNDAERWIPVANGQFIDIAVDPTDAARTLATDPTGQLRAYTAAGDEQLVPDAPALTYLDWPVPDELAGLAPDGTVYLSRDRGTTWQNTGTVPGRPSAFEVDTRAWYAASDTGLYTSTDHGDTWTPLFEYPTPP